MKVVVVGGGLAGLTAGHRLKHAGHDVAVREASARVGGILGTVKHDGFVVETGPDSILSTKPAAVELATELGIEHRIVRTNDAHRGAYVLYKGRLVHVPEGFSLMAPTRWTPWATTPIMSWGGKLRAAIEPAVPRRRGPGEESMAHFVSRRFGREVLDRLAQPLIGGIYGGDPERLSLEATMPRFVEMERSHGSVIRGMLAAQRRKSEQAASGARYGLFVAFDEGMQVLIDALAERLEGDITLEAPVESLERAGEGWRVDGEDADAVVLAVPAWRAAKLLAPIDAPLAHGLEAIRYGSAATVTFAWPREQVPHALDAFGLVVPSVERRAILAATFSSVKWPGRAPDGQVLLRVFLGGANAPDACDLEDEELAAMARRELERLMGISAEPRFTTVLRYRRAMPQYQVGHTERVEALEREVARHEGLVLAGNAYRGVGIPDTIAYAQRAADRLVA